MSNKQRTNAYKPRAETLGRSFDGLHLFKGLGRTVFSLILLLAFFGFWGSSVAQAFTAEPSPTVLALESQHLSQLAEQEQSHKPPQHQSNHHLDSTLYPFSFFLEEWEISSEEKELPAELVSFQYCCATQNQRSQQLNLRLHLPAPRSFSDLNHSPISIFFQVFRL